MKNGDYYTTNASRTMAFNRFCTHKCKECVCGAMRHTDACILQWLGLEKKTESVIKPVEELGISRTPWTCESGTVWAQNGNGRYGIRLLSGVYAEAHNDAQIMAASPDMYAALMDCCEEAMGDDVPRCYACRRDGDGHCMAKDTCAVFAALKRAGGVK